MMDDRAVSETLGFVLVFALVASTVAIVSLAGFTSLEEIKDDEQTNNAQRAFDVLAENMADVQEKDAPSRATEISLENAQIGTGDPITIRVNATDGDPTTTDFDETYRVTPIVYRGPDDGKFVYAAGSVFRLEPRVGGIVVRESPFVFDADGTVVPIIRTTTQSKQSIGGTTVLVRTNGKRKTVDLANTNGRFDDEVWLNVTSPRRDLWEEQLGAKDNLDCMTPSPATVACEMTVTPERLYVPSTEVTVEFER